MFPGFNPRELQRMLKRMGVKMETLEAERVEVKLKDGSSMVFEGPQVIMMSMRGQPPMVYIVGEYRLEEASATEAEAGVEVSDEDVRLVAEQAGVSLEEARRALAEAKGDIAEAILRLKGELSRS